jgi:hypothetical protein
MFNFLRTPKERKNADYKREIREIMKGEDYRGDDKEYPDWFWDIVSKKLDGYTYRTSPEPNMLWNHVFFTLRKMVNVETSDHDDPIIDAAIDHLLKPIKDLMKKSTSSAKKNNNNGLNLSSVSLLLNKRGGTRKMKKRKGTMRR